MSPPEKLKYKLLTPDMDRDGQMDGQTVVKLYALSTILNGRGMKKDHLWYFFCIIYTF